MMQNLWRTFSADGNVYMLKINDNNSSLYKIYLTDLKSIWCDEFSQENIVDKFKECNPTIIKIEEPVSEILKLLMDISNADVEINKSENKIDATIKSKIALGDANFNIKYSLTLSKADQNEFLEEITVPMIHTINYLEQQQTKLCELIQKKDRELEEYNMEKGSISRADLVTEKFDFGTLRKPSESLMLNIYNNTNTFWETFVNRYGNVKVQLMDVKVEPWNDVNRKRKVYNSKTASKKIVKGVSYKLNN